MKRREFLAASVGTGAVLAAGISSASAADAPAEKRMQVYLCEECGAVVEILEPGMAPVVHCGKPMKLMPEQTSGELAPKHVPVIEKIEGGYKVTIGAVEHPMLKAHHIVWIDLIADGQVLRQYLEIGAKPQAVFLTKAQQVSAREYCNLHGLWKKA